MPSLPPSATPATPMLRGALVVLPLLSMFAMMACTPRYSQIPRYDPKAAGAPVVVAPVGGPPRLAVPAPPAPPPPPVAPQAASSPAPVVAAPAVSEAPAPAPAPQPEPVVVSVPVLTPRATSTDPVGYDAATDSYAPPGQEALEPAAPITIQGEPIRY
jgi:hypothetical protein